MSLYLGAAVYKYNVLNRLKNLVVVAGMTVLAHFNYQLGAEAIHGDEASSNDLPVSPLPEVAHPLRSTRAERELDEILRDKAHDLDISLVSWLLAADIPEFADLTREQYGAQLDALTEQVRQNIAKMQKVATGRGEDLHNPHTRCGIFCNAIIKLGFAYTAQFRQEHVTPTLVRGLYADPNNICLPGLLRTQRGSCVSMPLLYLVVGQRLGMPVNLVAIGKHYFTRWEEPGYRMNIETTSVDRVAVTPDDSVYLETEGVKRDQLRGSELRNLTNREVVGNLFFARAGYWAAKGQGYERQRSRDLARARILAPEDPGIQEAYELIRKAVRQSTTKG